MIRAYWSKLKLFSCFNFGKSPSQLSNIVRQLVQSWWMTSVSFFFNTDSSDGLDAKMYNIFSIQNLVPVKAEKSLLFLSKMTLFYAWWMPRLHSAISYSRSDRPWEISNLIAQQWWLGILHSTWEIGKNVQFKIFFHVFEEIV